MNFVFVGTSLGARGTETHLVSLVRAMAQAGHGVVTVAREGGFIARELESHGLAVEPGVFRNAADVRGMRSVLRAIRRTRPQWLVGSFGHEYWPLLMLGGMTGTPVALFRHLNSRLKPMSRLLLPRWAHRFIAVSESMRSNLVEQGVAFERVRLLYNPLDVGYFRPDEERRAEARRALGVSADEVLIGFVGALKPEKGAFRLAEALNQAMPLRPGLRALWVGEEAAHPRLRAALAPELHQRHLLRGWTSDMRSLYAAMDVATMPSEWLEPFGRVSIEAQACGVPVLASRIGGLPETLREGETGGLVPPGDVAAWRDALLNMADMAPARRRAMGEAGARFVRERFAAERIVEEFLSMLEPAGAGPAGRLGPGA
ncbi:glycosyltransferase family 4 protein [Myxococcus sp. CA039A]|uniref:glycosyltransferase family 4 protein n=1 Tax=Myxococcus sp. CA039A TaxID=2741737 RepID=UPI00157A2686|nr:glycosyltransferase family 4 protein [Myxococcus sp. CA039A]NTX50297.1 glycosyltransferase family 4 protein [Myxococcus sp. CA039A]